MSVRAAFFDVGDTLVEHWAPREVVNARARSRICSDLGARPWLDDLLGARLEPAWNASLARRIARRSDATERFAPEEARQVTLAWYAAWFRDRGIAIDDNDLDRLRRAMCVPLDEISSPVKGAFEAIRWCKEQGLRVVLVTNTLSRGDTEALADWERFGMNDAIDGVASSHSVGWRKPHPAMFERALAIAGVRPDEAFHVGDNLIADVWGAQQLGIRGVWRSSFRVHPPTDERGAPHDTWGDRRRRDPATCEHPSESLLLRDGVVACSLCGGDAGVDVRPDAVLPDLTGLPALIREWLG
ncbi:MAG: HAD family hydrolase [Chloroflexi bacterium]|nr:HAD family hydrolase [Chloroflexota bacterium]